LTGLPSRCRAAETFTVAHPVHQGDKCVESVAGLPQLWHWYSRMYC
jgi:hypothetical protein